jgi:hypothetical protein
MDDLARAREETPVSGCNELFAEAMTMMGQNIEAKVIAGRVKNALGDDVEELRIFCDFVGTAMAIAVLESEPPEGMRDRSPTW